MAKNVVILLLTLKHISDIVKASIIKYLDMRRKCERYCKSREFFLKYLKTSQQHYNVKRKEELFVLFTIDSLIALNKMIWRNYIFMIIFTVAKIHSYKREVSSKGR